MTVLFLEPIVEIHLMMMVMMGFLGVIIYDVWRGNCSLSLIFVVNEVDLYIDNF